MKQILVTQPVTAISDRIKKAGKHPVMRAVCAQAACAQADFQRTEINQKDVSLLKGGSEAGTIKTHIADLPSDVQNLLAEEFERKVIAMREKLESEYAEIRRERNELADLNGQQAAKIEFLTMALLDARAKITERTGVIAMLKNEIAVGQEALAKAEQRIMDARQGLVQVEHKLDDPFPESSGGA